jgi:hypothetical protein
MSAFEQPTQRLFVASREINGFIPFDGRTLMQI